MLSIKQKRDSSKCEKMQLKGETMDCLECSCNICVAQAPTPTCYLNGLIKARDIVIKELEFAKGVNMQMGLGMAQILMLLNEEIDKY